MRWLRPKSGADSCGWLAGRGRLVAAATAVGLVVIGAATPLVWGKHPTNAGPENVEIKFKVPIPPALSPEAAMKTFQVEPGFKVELVASEPLVEDPIAISWAADGKMYVVEYRGYMHDVEGLGEDQPIGRIKLLEDTDGDGKMDKATVFVDGLVMPRAVMALKDGALVAEPPEVAFWRDTNKDGKADEKNPIAANYGTKGGQPEHMANGLLWGIDNWIYSAAYPGRFKVTGLKWTTEATWSRGQWGITQDDWGRLYYNYNSDVLRYDPLPGQYLMRNPTYRPTASTNVKLMQEQYTWPSHPTPGVNRGYQEEQLWPDGRLRTVTAACGPGVYRGELFPPQYRGNVFVPEPAGNLVKRVVVGENGDGSMSAGNAYEGKEFLTSTDERFRPVNAYTGPDGALYVVDLYRGVLQHKAFLTNYLLKNIADRKLEMPVGLGRIYRVVPEGASPKPVTKLPRSGAPLVDMLASPNGWVVDTAQRVLVEKRDLSAVMPLRKMATSGPNPVARVHALWALEGMGKMEPDIAVKAIGDADGKVRATAVRLCEPTLYVPATRAQVLPALLKLANDPSADVRLQLALTLGPIAAPDAEAVVVSLLDKDTANPLMRDAVISGLRGRGVEFMAKLMENGGWSEEKPGREEVLSSLAGCVLAERRTGDVKKLLDLIQQQTGKGAWRQVAMLEGMVPLSARASRRPRRGEASSTPVKLIYLDSKPEVLDQLAKNADRKVQQAVKVLDARLAWPGKPGVPPPPKIVPLTAAQQQQFELGREVYSKTCIACHQPSGLGQDGLAPPLVDSEWVLGPDKRLVRIVMHGVGGPITVDGTQHNLEMPPLGVLKDEEIAGVLTYVRREWEHNASPVSVDTVQQVRQETASRAEAWTAKELEKIK